MTEQVSAEQTGQMSHREIMEALTGLLLAMFVAMLSSTVVTNALPAIVTDLHGSQTGYTWVVVATLLTMTATTPIWGKLADLISKKMLVQGALVIYSAGRSSPRSRPNMGVLIGARAIQGLGVGGLTALVQVVIASMVSPRERGRYSGYIGAVFATATVSGPLLGGVIVDSPLGWRGCFFVGLPVAALAFVVLQKTLHLPVLRQREVSIDYLGATLIMGGVALLLVWVSLAGNNFAWLSGTTALMVGGGLALVAAALYVEARVAARADDPAATVQGPHHRPRDGRVGDDRRRDVRRDGLPRPVLPARPRDDARPRPGLMSIAMVGGLLVSSIADRPGDHAHRAVEAVPGRGHGRSSSSGSRSSAPSTRRPR